MKKKVLVSVVLMLVLCMSVFAIAAPVGGGTVGPGDNDPVIVAPEDPVVDIPSAPGGGKGHKYGHYRFRCGGWYFSRIFFFFFW